MMHNHKKYFPNLIHRSVYNRRRRALYELKERVRQYLVQHVIQGENTFVIDSMPISRSAGSVNRSKRVRICKDDYHTSPSYGFCAAQNSFYYGYKLHGVTTVDGIITIFDLSKAEVADIHYLNDIKDQYAGCILLGDKVYLFDPMQLELFEDHNLILKTPLRANQKNYVKQPAVFRKVRKRIETAFSQFCDQYKIQKNYAKTFHGLATRMLAKITGFTILQFLNKYVFDNHLNHVKHALL